MSTPPITSAAECVERLHASGHTFHLGVGGDVTTSHPLIPPEPAEMDAITVYLSRRWSEVMGEIRQQLMAGTSNLGSPPTAKRPSRG